MAAPKYGKVTEVDAASITGPFVGACATAVTTTTEGLDLSVWKGRYITMYCENADMYYCFAATATGTIVTAQSAVGTALVPARIYQGAEIHRVVPEKAPFLRFRTVTGTTGILRVHPS